MDGKNILITGGTGTFGNAFASYVLENYKPARLVIFSRDEYKQYTMARRFEDHEALRFFIGDVRDEERLNFALKGIDVVFHAAAMKQVVSSEYNPIECIKTNIEGAENLVRASINAGVSRVMAISTDKAVKPINLYGATKACMEKLFIAANHLAGSAETRFACARYGNVVGSRGSVVPLFREMRPTGTLTITDPRMSRFWLTIEQGVKFVDNCSQIMHGGEIFVSKTPSMMVTDLAKAMAPECEIKEIGIRPGEKLYEDLIGSEEAARTLEFEKFFVVKPAIKLWGNKEINEYAGETGKPVDKDFSYNSDNNTDWLDAEKLTKIISDTKVIH